MSFPQGRKDGQFAPKEKKRKRRGYTKKPTRTNDQKRLSILKYLNNAASSTKKEINDKCFAGDKDATLLISLVKMKWLELIPDNPNVEYRITEKGKEVISLFEQIKNEIDSENEPLFDFFKNYNKFEDDENS